MELRLSCQCGNVQGVAKKVSKGLIQRYICMCDDCQTYAHFLKRTDILDANGGTEIVPLYPADVKLIQGREHLACVRVSPNGPFRWYSSCCQTPLINSAPSNKTPHMGAIWTCFTDGRPKLDEILGPIKCRAMGKFGKGKLPSGTHMTMPLKIVLFVIIPFMLKGKILGKSSPNPFFKTNGNPVIEPYVLTKDERETIRRSL